MSVSHTDSIDKIVDYFATITKVPFSYAGRTYEPTLLKVSESLANGYTCPSNCGACCQRFSLDYIEGEKERPGGLSSRNVEFDGRTVEIWSDMQADISDDRCQYLSQTDARCQVHGKHPFTCDFELVRVYMKTIRNFNQIGVGKFGRSWQLTRFDGGKGTSCDILPAKEKSVADSVRKLGRLKDWASHFGLVDTWLPEIIDYLESGRSQNGPLYLGGPEEDFYTPPAKYDVLERLKELIGESKHTRPEIMAILMAEYPDVPKEALATIMTDSKNPKYSKFDRQVVIVDGIWQFG